MMFRRRLFALALPAVLIACQGDSPDAPRGPGISSLVLRAEAPPSLSRFGLNPTVEQVRATLLKFFPNESSDTIATKTVAFGANATSLNLSFSLLLAAAAETLTVRLEYQTSAGRTLFSAQQEVIAVAGRATTPPTFLPFYEGPGGNVTSVSIQPRSGTVLVGGTLNFSADAFDIQGAAIAADSVYLSWGASAGQINAQGTFKAPSSPGAVKIRVSTPSITGTADSVTVNVLAAGAGALAGQVIDGATGQGLSGVTISVFDANDSLVTSVVTSADGSYSTPPLTPGIYRIVASLNGFLGATLFDATLNGGGANTVPTIPLVPSTVALGDLTGVVKDATTNLRIAGATVVLRDGVNATASAALDTTFTDTGGNYQFSRHAAGTFTVEATATGYTPGYRTSVILGGGSTTGADVVLSPIGSGVVRIVLQWGATPPDLDSHLTGPDSTLGTRFHIYYANEGSLTSRPYANLDVDNTNGFGPETITLSQQFAGVYRYSVHDYTNGEDSTSQGLASSGAHVDLYIGGTLARSFFVPNQTGTLWTVFELNGTTITPINTMTYVADESTINLRASGSGTATDGRVIGQDLKRHQKN
jgi:Carboxypeptidase regulatory-like domain